MKGITKLGMKPVAILIIIASCMVVLASLSWQHQDISLQQQQQIAADQQQIALMIYASAASRIQALTSQVASTAKSPQLAVLIIRGDERLISAQQRQLSYLFPDASNICLIPANIDELDDSSCIPNTFAALNSLRQAKKKGSAPISVLRPGSNDARMLVVHSINDSAGEVVGVLAIVFKLSFINQLLPNEYGLSGYIELLQGTQQQMLPILKVGDKNAKRAGQAILQRDLANSYWRLEYWPAKSQNSPFSWLLAGVVIMILLMLWIIREMWSSHLLKHDINIVRIQLADFKEEKMKTKYPVAIGVFQNIVDDIQTMGRDNTQAKPRKKATAEAISKKLATTDAVGTGLIAENIEEALVVDSAIFKAYDIRGIVGEALNEDVVRIIGQAIGSEALEQGQQSLVVGRDGRLSSNSLSNALMEGLLSTGCDVIDLGQVPTPLMYFASEHLAIHSGVMVTGSHNPAQYNGLKIVLAGTALAGEAIQKLYQRIEQGDFKNGRGSKSGASVEDEYIARIVSDVRISRPVNVVIDCGNGVAGNIAPKLLTAIGCNVIELYCEVDGNFPNHPPNPSDPENLQDLMAAVKANEAELGLAFDGDGDRLIVVDAKGIPVWPDRIMMMFAQDVLSREPGAVVIYDVKSTNLLGEAISRAGGEALMWLSGHSNIKNKMQETGAQLAGEMSGHIFFKERWFGFDDGLYSACRLLELLASDPLQRTPTEVFTALPNRINTPEILVEMADDEGRELVAKLLEEGVFPEAQLTTIDGLRADYSNGWGLIRSSNTMPGLTLRFEADTAEVLQDIQQQFKQQILQIKPTLKLLF